MHILSFSHDSNLFGAQRSLLGLLLGLQQLGHRVSLALPGEGPLLDAAWENNVETHLCPYPYPSRKVFKALNFLNRFTSASRRIRRLAGEVRPDIVHFNTSSCLAPLMALSKSSIPRIVHLREKAPATSFTSRIIRSCASRVIANCRHVAGQYPLLSDRPGIDIVHNGLDLPELDENAIEAARAEMAGGTNLPIVLFAGQLRPHKDPMAVVECALELRRRQCGVRFAVLGSGPLEGELRQRITEQKLADSVWLAGYRQDALPYLAAADIVFIPSLEEPFPRTGLEAMASGRPVVATDVGGISEQVVDGRTGLLSRARDYINMSNDIEILITDAERRCAMGAAATLHHATHFSLESYAGGVKSIAAGLLE